MTTFQVRITHKASTRKNASNWNEEFVLVGCQDRGQAENFAHDYLDKNHHSMIQPKVWIEPVPHGGFVHGKIISMTAQDGITVSTPNNVPENRGTVLSVAQDAVVIARSINWDKLNERDHGMDTRGIEYQCALAALAIDTYIEKTGIDPFSDESENPIDLVEFSEAIARVIESQNVSDWDYQIAIEFGVFQSNKGTN